MVMTNDERCSFLNMCPTLLPLLQLVNLFTASFVANGSSWRWVLATELGSCFWRFCSVFAVFWLWLVLDCCWGVALLDLAVLLNTRGKTCGFTSCRGSCFFCCLDDLVGLVAETDFWAFGAALVGWQSWVSCFLWVLASSLMAFFD